jgi:hypothetical protein
VKERGAMPRQFILSVEDEAGDSGAPLKEGGDCM